MLLAIVHDALQVVGLQLQDLRHPLEQLLVDHVERVLTTSDESLSDCVDLTELCDDPSYWELSGKPSINIEGQERN